MDIVEVEEVHMSFGPYRVNRMIIMSIAWTQVPWWKRLGAVLALPYQLMRFLFVGNADILMVKNVMVDRSKKP